VSIEEAAQRLARELTQDDGEHQLSTLNPAKIRVLAVVHHLDRPCTDSDVAVATGWTRQYTYRLVNELGEQGILVRTPGPRHSCNGRPATHYQCICTTNQEGARS
jgi:DNA-binding MarR family transcriptional regulator